MSPSHSIFETIANQLHAQYGFKEIVWQSGLGGFSAINEKIFADGKPYVLKLTSLAHQLQVEQLIKAAILLSEKEIPVSIPLRTFAQDYFFRYGDQLCLVMPFIKGDILHEANFDHSALSSAASLLARFHLTATSYVSHFPSSHKFIRSVSDIKGEANNIIKSTKIKTFYDKTDTYLVRTIQLKLNVLETLPSTEVFLKGIPESNLIHGDFHNENIIFKDNKAIHMLDLEELRLGSRTVLSRL